SPFHWCTRFCAFSVFLTSKKICLNLGARALTVSVPIPDVAPVIAKFMMINPCVLLPACTKRCSCQSSMQDIPFLPLIFCNFISRSEEHTSELQSRENLVCRLL